MSHPIRWRINLLLSFMIFAVGSTGYFAASALIRENDLRDDLEQSQALRQLVSGLTAESFQADILIYLRKSQASLKPDERSMGLGSVIHAYSLKSGENLRKRIREFDANEQKFQEFIRPQIKYYQNQIYFFAMAGFASLIFGVLLAKFIFDRVLFRPLRRLYSEMLAFLEGRYTYQFSVPPPNEIGDLQNTFHSLAQRVLHNLDELKTLDQAKSDFLNIASHELRTPMTSIKGSLGLINTGVMGPVTNDIKDLLSIAENETDRLIRLTNDLLDMAKIEAGKLPLNQHWLLLEPLLVKTIRGLHGLAEKARVQVVIESLPQVEVFVDSDRIQQVLTNFLSNALKFSPAHGKVKLRGSINPENQLLIEVMDEGRGISPEDQARLFQKFKQVTNSENPLVKGTGLGLAIAKALIEEHSGKIGVQSLPGKGSTFYFTLPKWRAVDIKFSDTEKELLSA